MKFKLFKSLSTGVCEVWDGERWIVQSSITIFTAKRRRDEDRKLGSERRASAVSVDIRGAMGPSASSINGIYDPTDDICGGWPVYQKRGDSEKWLEHHAATNEWYVKPTADRNRAEGWMCLASDPPTRPELSRGLCEVWNGERWTVADSVTVLIASCAFRSAIDLDLFCYQEAKSLHERMRDSVAKAISILAIAPSDNLSEGNKQINHQIEELSEKMAKLRQAQSSPTVAVLPTPTQQP